MSTLRTLHDAFEALEERAEAAHLSSLDIARPEPDRLRPKHRWVPVSAAAAVAAVAVAAVALTTSQHARPTRPAGQAAANQPATSPTPTAPAPARFRAPSSPAQLAVKVREILAGTATITVTDTGSPVQLTAPASVPAEAPSGGGSSTPLPTHTSPNSAQGAPVGSAIGGMLTAAGRSGGFDLNVFQATPGSKASCYGATNCSVQTRPDGSTLAVGRWTDASVPGGITYQVEFVRADGADILLHLSTEKSPKGASTVTTPQLPLTTNQMIDFVSSDRW